MGSGSAPAGKPRGGHVNFIFLRAEFALENGDVYCFGQELNQWNSIPSDWDYELFDEDKEMLRALTTKKLTKLKTILERRMIE